jgi:hypothetical protein
MTSDATSKVANGNYKLLYVSSSLRPRKNASFCWFLGLVTKGVEGILDDTYTGLLFAYIILQNF